MGLFDKLFPAVQLREADGKRILNVPSGNNVREMGGYVVADGRVTLRHRFLRSGSTQYLSRRDIEFLRNYGVSFVVDLRGWGESPERTCALARQRDMAWYNVELWGRDMSDPKLMPKTDTGNYLVGGYLAMLGDHETVRKLFSTFAEAPKDACVLFHCAAGMDRTGVTAMLLLGLVGASRETIIKDYLYSFGAVAKIDRAFENGDFDTRDPYSYLPSRKEAIEVVYDQLIEGYGDVRAYLEACEVSEAEIQRVAAHLMEE